jgi:hypothetical protein
VTVIDVKSATPLEFVTAVADPSVALPDDAVNVADTVTPDVVKAVPSADTNCTFGAVTHPVP